MFTLIVRKELQDLACSVRFAVTFGLVSLLVLLAFYLGAQHHLESRDRYQAALAESQRQLEGQNDWSGVEPAIFLPPRPLAALVAGVDNDIGRTVDVGRGGLRAEGSRYGEEPLLALWRFLDLEFVFQVVLSLFAILFAFDAVSGEKERGTLRLALSSAVPRDTYILGKLTGTLLGLIVPLLVPMLMGCLLLGAMGVEMSADDWLRLALVLAAGLLFVGAVIALSILVSACTHRSSTSFLILLVLWIGAVLILPRASVLVAARAVDVPSADEAMSQRARLSRQLWREDRRAIQSFMDQRMTGLEGNGDAAEASAEQIAQVRRLQAEINEFLDQRHEERKRRIALLDARLEEESRNLRQRQQDLAFGLARLSPAAALSLASTSLAGTSLALPRHFLEQARAYREVFDRFRKSKGSVSGGIRVMVRAAGEQPEETAIDPSEMPVFEYRPPPVASLLREAVFDLGLLALYNLLFFAGAFVAFLRYDVR